MSELLVYAKHPSKLPKPPRSDSYSTCMVRLSRDEAIALIRSLAERLVSRSPNAGRLESYMKGNDEGQWYFSVAVHSEGGG